MSSRLAALPSSSGAPSGNTEAGHSEPPASTYSLFVVRWRRQPESEAIEVQHVQSGARTRVSSPARAVKWMSQRLDGTADSAPTSSNLEPEPEPASAP